MSSPQSRDWVRLLSVRNDLVEVHRAFGAWPHGSLVKQLLDAIGDHRRIVHDFTESVNDPLGDQNDDASERRIAGWHLLFATLNLSRANDAYHDHHIFAGANVEPASYAAELKIDFERHLELSSESLAAVQSYLG